MKYNGFALLHRLTITLLVLGIASCTASPAQENSSSPTPTRELMALAHPTATPWIPSATPSPVNSARPTTAFPPTITLTSTAAYHFPFRLCSPLAGWPLEMIPRIISDPYHPPPMGSDERHQGIDLAYSTLVTGQSSILGVVVTSMLPGRVAASISDSFPFGNLVIIETPREILPDDIIERINLPPGKSLYLFYGHMQNSPLVSLGQPVVPCHPLGNVGQTGNTAAPHLHLETRIGPPGAIFSSFSAFLDGTTGDQRSNYKRWRTSGEFLHFNPLLLIAPEAIPTPTPGP